jgi:hypothetical protein
MTFVATVVSREEVDDRKLKHSIALSVEFSYITPSRISKELRKSTGNFKISSMAHIVQTLRYTI